MTWVLLLRNFSVNDIDIYSQGIALHSHDTSIRFMQGYDGVHPRMSPQPEQ